MDDKTQFNPDDLIRQRMEYATDQHAKLLVVNADLAAEIKRLRLELRDLNHGHTQAKARVAELEDEIRDIHEIAAGADL